MKNSSYLMSGSTKAAPQSYVTTSLYIIRRISQAFTERYGEYKYSPIKVANEKGKRTGYGIAFWKVDKNGRNQLDLLTKKQVCSTVKWFEIRHNSGEAPPEWWLIDTLARNL